MKLVNPCRKCLVRACCYMCCEEKQDYESFMRKFSLYVNVIFTSLAVFSVVYLVHFLGRSNYSTNTRLLYMVLVWILPYLILLFLTYKEFTKDYKNGAKSETIGILLLMLISAPFFILYLLLADIYKKIFDYDLI